MALMARVPERHAGIVERMGRFTRELPPGRHRLTPVIEDLRPFDADDFAAALVEPPE